MIYCFLLIQEHTGPVKNAFSAVDRYEVKKTNVVKLKAKPSTVVKSSEESHQSHHQVIFIKSYTKDKKKRSEQDELFHRALVCPGPDLLVCGTSIYHFSIVFIFISPIS